MATFKQYVDPKTGKTISTRTAPPSGYKPLPASTGTNLSSVRDATGYNTKREATLKQAQEDLLAKNVASAQNVGYSKAQTDSFKSGSADPATAPRVVAPGVTTKDPVESLQDRLAEAQKKATMSGLDKARSQSLQALEQEQGLVSPQFAGQRSQARATSQRGARSFAQFMASRGLASSGGAALGETQRLGALQGELGGLRQQEQDVLTNIGQRRTGIETGYQSDVASANANMEAQALQNAINQANIDKQEQAQATALEREQFIHTLPQYSNDYKAFSDQILADDDPTNDWKSSLALTARAQKTTDQNLDPVTGQPLPDEPLSLSPSEARALWSITGTASQEIADALGSGVNVNDKYSTYAQRNKVTGGTPNPDPLPDAQSLYNYGQMKELLGRSQVSGQNAINWIAQNYTGLVAKFGEATVNKMANDIDAQLDTNREGAIEAYEERKAEDEKPVKVEDTEDAISTWASGSDGYLAATDKEKWLADNSPYMTDNEYKYFQGKVDKIY